MRTCDDIQRDLSLLLDHEGPSEREVEIGAHVLGCAACRGVLEDLDRLRAAARALGPIAPPVGLQLALEARLRAETGAGAAAAARDIRPRPWRWLGMAAALLLVAGAAYMLRVADGRRARDAAGNAPAVGAVELSADDLTVAMERYDKAAEELEVVMKTHHAALDPAVAATIDRNLAAIDHAIAESRVALAAHPESDPARSSLFGALRDKIAVLQTTVALVNQAPQDRPPGQTPAAPETETKS